MTLFTVCSAKVPGMIGRGKMARFLAAAKKSPQIEPGFPPWGTSAQ